MSLHTILAFSQTKRRGIDINDEDKNGFMMAFTSLTAARGSTSFCYTRRWHYFHQSIVDYLHKMFAKPAAECPTSGLSCTNGDVCRHNDGLFRAKKYGWGNIPIQGRLIPNSKACRLTAFERI